MNEHETKKTTIEDRAAGSIMGAFIGDALGLGPHWYYDLKEMHAAYGDWITDYTAPKPDRYHAGLEAGDLSQSGIIMEILGRSVSEVGEYMEDDFCQRLDRDLMPELDGDAYRGPGGYTNHSFRQVWQARVRDRKPWGETGGNADTSEAAERCTIFAARYPGDLYSVARNTYDNTRLSQTDSLVGQQSVAFALVLALLINGEPFDANLSGKLMEQLEEHDVPFVAETSTAATGEESLSLGFASPDALLLPSWIAASAKENIIDPAWKVSQVYGMSCAINYVLPASYYLAAKFSDDFESAVLHALNGGGQNMSRACMTGALVGAQVGLSKIPKRFIDGLSRGAELVELAKAIAASADVES